MANAAPAAGYSVNRNQAYAGGLHHRPTPIRPPACTPSSGSFNRRALFTWTSAGFDRSPFLRPPWRHDLDDASDAPAGDPDPGNLRPLTAPRPGPNKPLRVRKYLRHAGTRPECKPCAGKFPSYAARMRRRRDLAGAPQAAFTRGVPNAPMPGMTGTGHQPIAVGV